MSQSQQAVLKAKLGDLYLSYGATYVDTDPIQFPHRYRKSRDREVAGFVAAALAYGNVPTIKSDLERIFAALGPAPYEAVLSARADELLPSLGGFKHRFTTAKHMAWFLLVTKNVLSDFGSLKSLFLEGYSSDQPSIKESLIKFVDGFLGLDGRDIYCSV